MATKQLVEAPASDSSNRYETLGYVEAYDAVLNDDYAYVAYKETGSDGEWRVRIKAKGTAGAPELTRPRALENTGARGPRLRSNHSDYRICRVAVTFTALAWGFTGCCRVKMSAAAANSSALMSWIPRGIYCAPKPPFA